MMKNWWKKAVIYQVYPRSFKDSNDDGVGDINGITEQLDYLKKLGIDAIWLSPLYQSPMVDNGYDISDYYKIDPLFGKMSDFDELLEKAKNIGIRLIMDLVVNHTSNQHLWFKEVRKSRDNSKRDFYIWRDQPVGERRNWTYDSSTQQYYFHLFSPQQPDLNWENEELRKEIYKMMNFWLDKGISGFRLDVIDLIGKQPDQGITVNGPKLHEYLKEMNLATFGAKDCLTVGEAWSSSPELAKLYSSPNRQELSMVFGFWHLLTSAGNGNKWEKLPLDVSKLKEAMAAWQKLNPNEAWNSLFLGNHDLPRIVSFWGDEGENREKSAKAFAILFHLMRGTPFIYQGEELGMTNFPFENLSEINDLESHEYFTDKKNEGKTEAEIIKILQEMSRDNARTPMQWTSDQKAGFTNGKPWLAVNPNATEINADQAVSDSDSIFYTYQKLIELRHKEDWLVEADFELIETTDKIFAYLRKTGTRSFLVLANLSKSPQHFQSSYVKKSEIISNDNFPNLLTDLEIKPWQAFALEIENVD
ncbi:glycoside hydrolase family 13 protein [Lactococcus cremoris]|nr:alpha-glucosidase [Lactococcus cremoris]